MTVLLALGVSAALVVAVLLIYPAPTYRRTFTPWGLGLGRGSGRDGGWRQWRDTWRGRTHYRSAQIRSDTAEFLRQFSALLLSGRGEGQAFADLYRHWRRRDLKHPLTSLVRQIWASEQSGAGIAEGMRRCLEADQTSGESNPLHPEIRLMVRRLAAATALSEQTGAPLRHLVDQMATSMDEASELRATVASQVAGPKLTQLILTLLPAGGILMGQVIGADPLATLFGTSIGLLCLTLSLVFLMVGRLWSSRMIRRVEASG